jgi:hypothetical protein
MKFKDLETKDTKKIEYDRLEPGHLEPLANYQIIGQGCDVCNDVEMHLYNKKAKIIMCLTCRTTKQLK